MEKKAASTGGNSNMVWIIVGGLVLLIAGIYFAMNGSSQNKTIAPDLKTDAATKAKAEADAKAAADAAAKAKAEADAKAQKDAIDNPPKYKRPGDAISMEWSIPKKIDLDYYVRTMRQTGWSDDMISYGAAWMKGMNLPINTHWATTQIKDIRDFMKKYPYLKRNDDFALEIQNYPFFPGDLVDDEYNTFGRLRFG